MPALLFAPSQSCSDDGEESENEKVARKQFTKARGKLLKTWLQAIGITNDRTRLKNKLQEEDLDSPLAISEFCKSSSVKTDLGITLGHAAVISAGAAALFWKKEKPAPEIPQER